MYSTVCTLLSVRSVEHADVVIQQTVDRTLCLELWRSAVVRVECDPTMVGGVMYLSYALSLATFAIQDMCIKKTSGQKSETSQSSTSEKRGQ